MPLSLTLWSFLKSVSAPLLSHPTGLYRFHEDTDSMVQILEAPLWGGKASLVLLLPFHVENLARLNKLLTLELLSEWLEKTSLTSVAISMPKANITNTLSLQVSRADDVFWEIYWKTLRTLALCASLVLEICLCVSVCVCVCVYNAKSENLRTI